MVVGVEPVVAEATMFGAHPCALRNGIDFVRDTTITFHFEMGATLPQHGCRHCPPREIEQHQHDGTRKKQTSDRELEEGSCDVRDTLKVDLKEQTNVV